jgi:hypothetical protein
MVIVAVLYAILAWLISFKLNGQEAFVVEERK